MLILYMYVNVKRDRFQRNFSKLPIYSLRMTGRRVKRVTSGREKTKEWGYTDRCSPADGSINGFADNLQKYCARQRKYRASVREIRKIRVERALLPSFARNFFPFYPRGREETGGKKRNRSGKIGNGSTFLADENSRLTHSLLFTTPSPFRYHLLSPKASLYCNLVV